METKKNKKADLNRYKTIFFETGLIIAISLMITAFEWKTDKMNVKLSGYERIMTIEEMLPITVSQPEKPKPPIPPRQIPDFTIVDNNSANDTNSDLPNTEADESTSIPWSVTLPPEPETDEIIPSYMAEKMAEFSGGTSEMMKYIVSRLSIPEEIKSSGIGGTLFVSFLVTKTGEIKDIEIIRGLYPGFDQSVCQIISSMPRWIPAEQNGRKVSVRVSLPVKVVIK